MPFLALYKQETFLHTLKAEAKALLDLPEKSMNLKYTMNMKSSSWMKCQYHHSCPIQIPCSSTTTSSNSFNFNSPAFVTKETPSVHLHLKLSSKTEYWAIKSKHNDEQQITPAGAAIIVRADDADDDKELKRKRKRRIMRIVTGAAATIGVGVIVVMGEDKAAWAVGPEGPMVEEFWENVRRYGLYALTVSTGVLYAVLQPIVELLKNPISALLVILIFGGSFFLLSQILSAMFGVSDFAYQYAS